MNKDKEKALADIEENEKLTEHYGKLYQNFLTEISTHYHEYSENIALQLNFRENTVKTAYHILKFKGNNDQQKAELKKRISEVGS